MDLVFPSDIKIHYAAVQNTGCIFLSLSLVSSQLVSCCFINVIFLIISPEGHCTLYLPVREMSVYKCCFALLLALQHVYRHFVSICLNVILTKLWHLTVEILIRFWWVEGYINMKIIQQRKQFTQKKLLLLD